jgi:hypothetical protein
MEMSMEARIRQEEEAERRSWLLNAVIIFVMAMLLVAANNDGWSWWQKLIFYVCVVLYYVGYRRCYPIFYEWMMHGHPMRSSGNYRMTDGHLLAWIFSFFWPLLWLGRTLMRAFKNDNVRIGRN